jgi:hypothetical protein
MGGKPAYLGRNPTITHNFLYPICRTRHSVISFWRSPRTGSNFGGIPHVLVAINALLMQGVGHKACCITKWQPK